MLHVVSKTGKVNRADDQLYNILSDFRNLGAMIPKDKIQDWQATDDECSFSVNKAGTVTLRAIEKEPNKLIKIEGGGVIPSDFFFWIQLKDVAPYTTAVRLTVKADMNKMMQMMVKKQLKKGLDTIIDNLEKI